LFGGGGVEPTPPPPPPPQADSANAITTAQPVVARNRLFIPISAQAAENSRLPQIAYG
jgi:hypothetical protein